MTTGTAACGCLGNLFSAGTRSHRRNATSPIAIGDHPACRMFHTRSRVAAFGSLPCSPKPTSMAFALTASESCQPSQLRCDSDAHLLQLGTNTSATPCILMGSEGADRGRTSLSVDRHHGASVSQAAFHCNALPPSPRRPPRISSPTSAAIAGAIANHAPFKPKLQPTLEAKGWLKPEARPRSERRPAISPSSAARAVCAPQIGPKSAPPASGSAPNATRPSYSSLSSRSPSPSGGGRNT